MPTKKFDILKVKDKSDSYYKQKDRIFDLSFRLIINGKSFLAGKTSLILNLILRDKYYKKDFDGDNIFIVSNNKLDNKIRILMKEKDIPKANYMKYDESELEILYDQLEQEAMDEVNDNKKMTHKLIIFDDVASSGNLKNKQAGIMSTFFMNGRHANISCVVTSQKFSLLGANLRSNCTGAILFNTSQKELELIAEDFNYMEKKSQFMKMFRDIAGREKHSFLCVNFSNPRNELYLDKNFEPIDESKYL